MRVDTQDQRITHAYVAGIDLRNELRDGASLCAAIQSIDGPFETLDDGYPDWHPGPHPFEGVLKLFYYREITGQSYRDLAEYPELADAFGLTRIPDESVLSRAWRHRFDDGVREFIETGAHYVVKEIHDRDLGVPAARSKTEVVTPRDDPETVIEKDLGEPFTDEQIYRTTRLAREHGFEGFDSERAANATYDDTQFFELRTYRVRLFYFVFAVVLHNIWRLTDFPLKAGVDGDMDCAPILTAGECVELVCGDLIPPD